MYKLKILVIVLFLQLQFGATYPLAQTGSITRQETLRGSITREREWWDLLHYHLKVEFFPDTRRLRGSNIITFKTLKPGNKMQIDLQPPLAITRVTHGASQLKFEREGNVYWLTFEKESSDEISFPMLSALWWMRSRNFVPMEDMPAECSLRKSPEKF